MVEPRKRLGTAPRVPRSCLPQQRRTMQRQQRRTTAFLPLLLPLLLLASCAQAQKWKEALRSFSHDKDIPSQRAALETLYATLGTASTLGADSQGQLIGSPGLGPWRAANTSYCTWWGVNCCGATLTTSLKLCTVGANSVSGLHLVSVGLVGKLPDVFDQLPDLQYLDMAYNRGAWLSFSCHHMHAEAAAEQQSHAVAPALFCVTRPASNAAHASHARPQTARMQHATSTPPRSPQTQVSSATCPRASRPRPTSGWWT